MSKYRKHIWANETMPYYKQYLNEMEAQIDKLTKEGGGGGSGPLYIATYIISAINTETDFECNFAVQHFQTDNTLAEDVQSAVNIVTENGEREDILASGYIAGEDIEGTDGMSPYPISSIHNMHISDDNKLIVEFWSSYLGDLNAVEFDSYELKASNIKEIAAGGGSGGSGMQKYEIFLDWNDDNEEYIFTHNGERLTFEDVTNAIAEPNNYVFLTDYVAIYNLASFSEDKVMFASCYFGAIVDNPQAPGIAVNGYYMNEDGQIFETNVHNIPSQINLIAIQRNDGLKINFEGENVSFDWLREVLTYPNASVNFILAPSLHFNLALNTPELISFTRVSPFNNGDTVVEFDTISIYPDDHAEWYSKEVQVTV